MEKGNEKTDDTKAEVEKVECTTETVRIVKKKHRQEKYTNEIPTDPDKARKRKRKKNRPPKIERNKTKISRWDANNRYSRSTSHLLRLLPGVVQLGTR